MTVRLFCILSQISIILQLQYTLYSDNKYNILAKWEELILLEVNPMNFESFKLHWAKKELRDWYNVSILLWHSLSVSPILLFYFNEVISLIDTGWSRNIYKFASVFYVIESQPCVNILELSFSHIRGRQKF